MPPSGYQRREAAEAEEMGDPPPRQGTRRDLYKGAQSEVGRNVYRSSLMMGAALATMAGHAGVIDMLVDLRKPGTWLLGFSAALLAILDLHVIGIKVAELNRG